MPVRAKKKPSPRKVPRMPKKEETKIYRGVCHTKCYWMSTLWEVNDVYEGPAEPPKHFSKDGVNPDEDPKVVAAGDDPRSTTEMLTVLKRRFGVDPPVDKETGLPAARQVVFELLKKHELAASGAGGLKSTE